MASIYKFKLTFEDYEDINRVIEIKSTSNFLDLHKIILKSINFDEKHMASFYMSNDSWKKFDEITLENMSDESEKPKFEMKKTRLCDHINDPHQKIIYIYDFIELWTLHLEMVGIDVKEKAGVEYPRITKTLGLSPKQYAKVQNIGNKENEFDEITKNYLNKTEDVGIEISDDEADEHGLFEDESEEEISDDNNYIEE